MVEKEKIIQALRDGVKTIYTKFSPPGNQEMCKEYHNSSHPSREFLFVVSGESFYMFNNSVYPCSKGTLFLIDSRMSHGHRYTVNDNNLLHIWGYFTPNHIHLSAIKVTQKGQYHVINGMFQIKIPEGLREHLKERWNMFSKLNEATNLDVEHYIKIPINALLDEMAFQISEQMAHSVEYTQMKELKNYILSKNGRDCSLAQLAEISGYTKGYLASKFHNEVGITIGEYINKVRLDYTQMALQRGIRQKEIAYELGFSSPTAFWNWHNKANKNK